jgi:sulfur-oxidizing protein SoxX
VSGGLRGLAAPLFCAALAAGAHATPPKVDGDTIPQPLAAAGIAERGRALVADSQTSLCLLCHAAPLPEPNLHGDIGPDLAGVGARLTAGQLRLRVADARRLNPDSLMPTYLRRDGFIRAGSAWAGKPVLDAQQIEDVVAWLQTLK